MRFLYAGGLPSSEGLSPLTNTNTDFSPISSVQMSEINSLLPEGVDVPEVHPDWIRQNNNLVVTDPTEIVVTFVKSTAWYRNSLAYFTYSINNPVEGKWNIGDFHFIFPNANQERGPVKAGDSVKLYKSYLIRDSEGKEYTEPKSTNFPVHIGIGFVLVQDGWKDGYVKYDADKFYSQIKLNPEFNEEKKVHSVLLPLESEEDAFIMGFEDLNREFNNSNDFNDLIIKIKIGTSGALSSRSYHDHRVIFPNAPSNYTIGYKKIYARVKQPWLRTQDRVVEAVAKLFIPIESEIIYGPDWVPGKRKTNRAFVAGIFGSEVHLRPWNLAQGDQRGKSFAVGQSFYFPWFEYRVGEFIEADGNIHLDTNKGIHYFEKYEQAENYYFQKYEPQ